MGSLLHSNVQFQLNISGCLAVICRRFLESRTLRKTTDYSRGKSCFCRGPRDQNSRGRAATRAVPDLNFRNLPPLGRVAAASLKRRQNNGLFMAGAALVGTILKVSAY
jgi:hypothetical protein